MKRILFLAAFMLLSMAASAQDIIVKKNGEEIRAKVEEVGERSIRYRKFTNLTGPVYSISRSEVFVIRYESGAKDIITPLDRPAAAGKRPDPGGMYSLLIWSSTEVSESASAICGNRDFYSPDKTEAGYPKAGQTCVRAVHKF